jgi:signal transduction histidine kinase
VAAARFDGDSVTPVVADRLAAPLPWPALPFLYDLRKDRALKRDGEGDLRNFRPSEVLPFETASALALEQGFAIPVSSDAGEGLLFAEGVRALSTDDLERGDHIAADAAAQLQRNALLRAAEERAAGRSRTSLARDLHDSVVQFLAGAAFRLEAMKRGAAAGTKLVDEIEELKQLMLHEQGELRAFIAALRSGSSVAMSDVASELRVLADRLAKHWSVACAFTAEPVGSMIIPARLHRDAQQLVREAVANAVRHAGARTIDVRLAADSATMRLEVINDGAAYPKSKDGGRMPQSLRERVEEVGGAIELSRGMGVTRLSISLPIGGVGA